METVNRQNCMNGERFEHVLIKNRDNSPARAKRNGKTKVWVTRPNEFKIPVKHGLYDYFYIDQNNGHEWVIA